MKTKSPTHACTAVSTVRFEQDVAEVLGRRVGMYVEKHNLRCARAGRCEDGEGDEDEQ